MSAKILVVDDDPLNLKIVERVLSAEGDEYEVALAHNGPEALEMMHSFAPDLVILDVMMPDMDGYEVCRRAREDPEISNVLILLLTAHSSVESRIAGFQAGADDFLAKPFHPAELIAHIQALLRRRVVEPEQARSSDFSSKVIAFFSLRGGVGVSTFATNIAVALAQIWRASTALVDLVLTCGQSAMMLNQTSRNTWADLASMPPEDCTLEIVEQALIPHESGVRTLAAPPSSELAEVVNSESVQHVLDLLTTKYDYVILDLPHDFRETTLVGLDKADQIIVVFAPEIMSVYAAKRTLDTFSKLDYSDDRVSLLMNWTFAAGGLARRSIESALGKSVSYVMPFAEGLLVEALNLGVPAVMRHQKKPLAAVFEDLAYYLSKPEHRKMQPKSPSPAWKRVMERQKKRRAEG